MHRISLVFESRTLQAQYQADTRAETEARFFNFVVLELFFCLVFLVYSLIVSADTATELAKFLSIFLLMLLLLLLRRLSFRCFYCLLKPIFLCSIILFIEIIKTLQASHKNNGNVIFLAIPLQIMLCMLCFTRTRWHFCALYYFCTILYFLIRIVDFDHYIQPNFVFVVIVLFLCFLGFSLMAYTQERMEKCYYKALQESCENLHNLKALMKTIMPSPVFIFDPQKNQMIFENNPALQFLSRNSANSQQGELSPFSRKGSLQDLDGHCLELDNLLKNFLLIGEKDNKNVESFGEVPNLLQKYYENSMNLSLISDFSSQNVPFFTLNVMLPSKTPEDDSKFHHLENLKHKRFYEIKALKIFWEKTVCLLLIFTETTDSFRVSELLNLDLYKNQLLASVTHDLRTPLNGLTGMLEMAISRISDPEISQNLILASKSAQMLNFLIKDILDFSQINFKKLRLNLEEVDLREIISEISNLIEFQAKERNIEFQIILPKEMLKPISSDANRIKQILLNLLSNSLKFTNSGYIRLQIDTITANNENPVYMLSVEDSGIGIRSEDICKLFKLFGRLDTPKGINKAGIGLGLTISKMLSQMLSPSYPEGLCVKSEYGKGSCFSFHLTNLKDAVSCEDFERIEEKTRVMLPESRTFELLGDEKNNLCSRSAMGSFESIFGGKKVLVVDDDLINVLIVEQYLGFFKLKSLRALNGLEAFQRVQKDILEDLQEICLIVMDCHMPILDGYQASTKIHDFIKLTQARDIPILAVTANLTTESREICKKSGMQWFLEKPMKRDDFKNMIEEILKVRIG